MTRSTKSKIVILVLIVSAITGIICVIYELPYAFKLITATVITTALISYLNLAKCPFCGKYGLTVSFFHSNTSCKKCGRQK